MKSSLFRNSLRSSLLAAELLGTRGRIVITQPAGTAVETTPSRKLGTLQLATLRFRSEDKAGQLVTKVRLEQMKQ